MIAQSPHAYTGENTPEHDYFLAKIHELLKDTGYTIIHKNELSTLKDTSKFYKIDRLAYLRFVDNHDLDNIHGLIGFVYDTMCQHKNHTSQFSPLDLTGVMALAHAEMTRLKNQFNEFVDLKSSPLVKVGVQ